MADKRKFIGSICVRFGTDSIRIQLASAEDYGGPKGFYRLRANRRWFDAKNGKPYFANRDSIAGLIAHLALVGMPDPLPMPDIPRGSRVSVTYEKNGRRHSEGLYTSTPPILAQDGRWHVGVQTVDGGYLFIPEKDIIVHRKGKS